MEELEGLNSQHKARTERGLSKPVEICTLTNEHLECILNKHVQNVRSALDKQFDELTLRDCAIVCNFTKYIAPYVQELLVRGLWKNCQYALENAYKRSNRVSHPSKATPFTQEFLQPYKEKAEEFWWGEDEGGWNFLFGTWSDFD